jgi:hypothetical protein
MARKRYISSDLSTAGRLSQLGQEDLLAPLLYTWLIPHLDDWGRSSGDAHELRLLVIPGLPVTNEQVEGVLVRLEAAGLVHRYWVGGRFCLAVDPDPFYRQ